MKVTYWLGPLVGTEAPEGVCRPSCLTHVVPHKTRGQEGERFQNRRLNTKFLLVSDQENQREDNSSRRRESDPYKYSPLNFLAKQKFTEMNHNVFFHGQERSLECSKFKKVKKQNLHITYSSKLKKIYSMKRLECNLKYKQEHFHV